MLFPNDAAAQRAYLLKSSREKSERTPLPLPPPPPPAWLPPPLARPPPWASSAKRARSTRLLARSVGIMWGRRARSTPWRDMHPTTA
jgi:hypothetical protein